MNELLNVNHDVMPLTVSTLTISNTLDESRNRGQHGLHMETVKEIVEVNMLIETMDQEIDSNDELKNRLNVKSLKADGACKKKVVTSLQLQTDSDPNDALQNRMFGSTLTTNVTPGLSKMKIDVADMENQDQERTSKSWRGRSVMSDLSKNSTSREDRCSMSTHQKVQQPVTPVQELKHIEPTRLNIHDVDECAIPSK